MARSLFIALALTFILPTLTGCGIFTTAMPDYILYNLDGQDRLDWRERSRQLSHPKVWKQNMHRMMLNSASSPITGAHQAVDLAFFGVKEAATQLESLEDDGARFKVKLSAAGKFKLEVYKPTTASNVAQDAIAKLMLQPTREDWVEMMFNNVGRGSRALVIDSVHGMELLYYRTVTELHEVKNGKELGFNLPEGITRDDYLQLLDVLLVGFHNDMQEIKTYQAALASAIAATASIDSDAGGGVDNIYLVLNATLEDRKRYKKRRDALATYPPPADMLPALREEAAQIHAQALESPRYQQWTQESHAWRELSNFGDAVGEAFSTLSEFYGSFGGVDLIGGLQERLAEGVSLDLMLDLSLHFVPAGSELHTVLQTGKRVYTNAQKVAAAVDDPSAAAGDLLLWAAPDEVQRARQQVKSISKPTR